MADDHRKRFRYWPGMPTKGSQFLESIVMLLSGLLVLLVALLLALRSLFR